MSRFCLLPWLGLDTSALGLVRPCCVAKEHITDSFGTPYNLKNSSLIDVLNSDYMVNMRKQFRAGEEPATCKQCWDEEAAGKRSLRQGSLALLSNVDIKLEDKISTICVLDLKLGTTCNLKCRTCGSWSSSKWLQEEFFIFGKTAVPKGSDGSWLDNNPGFWDDIKKIAKTTTTSFFKFTGGEPFLIKEHFELLKYFQDADLAKNITLHYNTNGTILVDPSVWEGFKKVEIVFSIDNIKERFEYERYNAKWNEVEKNIDTYLQKTNCHIRMQPTISIFNILYLPELLEWINKRNLKIRFNMVYNPRDLSILHLPIYLKDYIREKLFSGSYVDNDRREIFEIINMMYQTPSFNLLDLLRKRILASDKYRRQDIGTSHPELKELLFGKKYE